MKPLAILILVFAVFAQAEETQPTPVEPQCPQFSGEYVAFRCPTENTAYSTVRIRQPNCTAIGYSNINYSKDGLPNQSSPTIWDVIGAGKMHSMNASAKDVEFVERIYTNNSLFEYTYLVDKVTEKVSQTTVTAINSLEGKNLLSSYFSSSNVTYINIENCKSLQK